MRKILLVLLMTPMFLFSANLHASFSDIDDLSFVGNEDVYEKELPGESVTIDLGETKAGGLIFGILGGVAILIPMILFYIVSLPISIGMYVISKKMNLPKSWLAFIPLLNIYTFVKIAGKNGTYIFMFFIPIVGFFIPILLTNEISIRTGGKIGRTLGLLIFPFFAYPIVAYKFKPLTENVLN